MLHDDITATTGAPALDRVLDGLYWGDNVVLDAELAEDVTPFYAAVAGQARRYAAPAFVAVAADPRVVLLAHPELDVVDAGPSTPLHDPDALLGAIAARAAVGPRQLLLFDSLDAMSRAWGHDEAGRFFERCCPMLLGHGAVAYWSLPAARRAPALRRRIEGITQCVLDVGDGRLRIAKAEGRPAGVEGSVFRYVVRDGLPELEAAPAAARLGAALKRLRVDRHLSQSQLARLARVSPSAISQAERGRRGLSLDTLLELSGRLGMTLDELLRGEPMPGYRLARRDDPRHTESDRVVPLLDDPRAGLRAYLVRLSPGGSASREFAHKGVELVAVATGLVQVQLESGSPVLRQGESLIADRSGVEGWRNLGDREALAFWILHGPAGA